MTRRIVQHSKYQANKSLYDYPRLEGLSDDPCRVVFLSERDMSIIAEALQWSDHQRTRVYVGVHSADHYTLANDEEWSGFRWWISQLRANLGAWIVSNEFLERIAVATEAIADHLDHDNKGVAQIMAEWADRSDTNLTDLIDEIEAQTTLADDVQDLLYFLKLFRDLLPSIHIPLPDIVAMVDALMVLRYRHNDLTLKAYQATSLRHIGNALAPVLEDENETEESLVTKAVDAAAKVPWLTAFIVSVVDPSPAGEATVAVKLGLAAKSLYDKAKSMWLGFRDAYINQVGNPQPQATVVGMLNEIAARMSGVGGNIGLNVEVLNDCSDCGTDGGIQTPTGDLPAELQYLCNASRWYTGIVVDKLTTVVAGALEVARPTLSESQWNEFFNYAYANAVTVPGNLFFDDLAVSIATLGAELTPEEQQEVIDVTTVFVNDWGNEMVWSQDQRSQLYGLLTEGVIYPGQGPSGADKVIPLDILSFLSIWIDNQQSIIDAIYQATSASNARQNLIDLFDTIYPDNIDGTTNYGAARQALSRLLSHQNVINKVFSMDVSQSEIDRYSDRVLGSCTEPSTAADCSPTRSSEMLAGTPDTLQDNIPDNGTYTTSQWPDFNNGHYIAMKLHGWYEATLDNLVITPGKTIAITALDCDDNQCWQQTGLDADDMPYNVPRFAYLVIGVGVIGDPQFSINISFTPSSIGGCS